jgi:hypothetical protein
MRISVSRRGGFAGTTIHREIDTTRLAGRDELERLARRACAQPAERPRMPDAFEYEITIDGKTYVVSDEHPAWRALIERLFASPGIQ